jgi:drug/metabolite transporter (DMT)-like permease
MSKKALFADSSMLMVAVIWGFTFPMVKGAIENFPVFSFLAVRFAIASVGLLLLTWRSLRLIPRKWVVFGLLTGLVNFAGFAFQTYGLHSVAPGRTAFITGLYGALVPLMLAVIGRGRISRVMWFAIALSVAGLMLLFWHDLTFSFSLGDGLIVLCAVAFAAQIVMVGSFPRDLNPMPMATIQALACLGAAIVLALVTDRPLPALPVDTLGAAVFTGLAATALALVVQSWAQRHTPTSHAALIFCTEPVWGAIAGVAMFGEKFTPIALIGCGLMLVSMVVPDLSVALSALTRRRLLDPTTAGAPAR